MIIAVDFDGTCVDHLYPAVGKEVPFAAATIEDLINAGHTIILYTMRSGAHLVAATNWFTQRGLVLHGVQIDPEQSKWTTSSKCHADLYIDDRNFGCPLIEIKGYSGKCVDWQAVRAALLPSLR